MEKSNGKKREPKPLFSKQKVILTSQDCDVPMPTLEPVFVKQKIIKLQEHQSEESDSDDDDSDEDKL